MVLVMVSNSSRQRVDRLRGPRSLISDGYLRLFLLQGHEALTMHIVPTVGIRAAYLPLPSEGSLTAIFYNQKFAYTGSTLLARSRTQILCVSRRICVGCVGTPATVHTGDS